MSSQEVNQDFEYKIFNKTVNPKVIKCDLDSEVVLLALDTAIEALHKYTIERDLSDYIKQRFDEELEPFWHVVVGNDFSVSLTHNSRNFIFFLIEKNYFLIFKL